MPRLNGMLQCRRRLSILQVFPGKVWVGSARPGPNLKADKTPGANNLVRSGSPARRLGCLSPHAETGPFDAWYCL
jgi:hypothetical protein